MAAFQVLKLPISPISVSHPKLPGKLSWVYSESNSRGKIKTIQGVFQSSRLGRSYFFNRFSVSCAAQESDSQANGEETPESLFMKELKRRGMTPTSLLEDTNWSEVGLGSETADKGRGFSKRNSVSTKVDKSLSNQRERSMLLNSEGLEGLIPRAKLLLTIGGTFFLGFWPLILVTVGVFSVLYFYFGATFIHDASRVPVAPPQYVDPYVLLEDERISQIAAPHTN